MPFHSSKIQERLMDSTESPFPRPPRNIAFPDLPSNFQRRSSYSLHSKRWFHLWRSQRKPFEHSKLEALLSRGVDVDIAGVDRVESGMQMGGTQEQREERQRMRMIKLLLKVLVGAVVGALLVGGVAWWVKGLQAVGGHVGGHLEMPLRGMGLNRIAVFKSMEEAN